MSDGTIGAAATRGRRRDWIGDDGSGRAVRLAGTPRALRIACVTLALLAGPASAADDPLTRPLAPQSASRWLGPQPPVRIHGNTYLVGFGGLNVAVIRTDAGLVLVDAALPQAVPQILANVRRLGFDPRDVKLILSTEPHFDHAGGLAALARDTGGTVVASAPAAEVLRAGRSGADDPQAAWLPEFPPVPQVRALRDGETLALGGVTITARATPGHTPGSMSWSWRSCEPDAGAASGCVDVVFASSLNPVAAEDYRYSDPAHGALAAAFRRTFASLRALPCDLLITAHPDQSGGDAKLARFRQQPRPNPFLEPGACRDYAERYERAFDELLAKEAAARDAS